ncbi:MAG: alpha/beta fold hydrolase [Acidobacteria bacterium]|nr:alpha/beta fold hydrolase [Acidobacteriota bacterium]
MQGYAEVNRTRLYYEATGSGRPVVFIGVGGGMDHRLWDDQFEVFAREFQVVRYDVRGWGKSAWPTEPFSPLEDLAALLDFLKIEKACLVGLSLGGALAIDFALAHSERVECLVLVAAGVSGHPFSEEFQKWVAPFMAALQEGDTERYVQLLLDDPHLLPAPKNPAAREKAKRVWAENSRLPTVAPIGLDPPALGRLGEIRVPALLVVGDRDTPDLYDIARRLEAGIAGLRRVNISNSGHTVNMERPEEFNQAVLLFLRALEGRE